MKVYLAACFEQQQEVRDKAEEIGRLGFICTSTWRFEDGTLPPTPEHLDRCASNDLADLRAADCFVCLTDMTSNRGGKHVELGYALALGKPSIIVGRRENIFHSLRVVNFVESWEDALSLLLDWKDARRAVAEA